MKSKNCWLLVPETKPLGQSDIVWDGVYYDKITEKNQ